MPVDFKQWKSKEDQFEKKKHIKSTLVYGKQIDRQYDFSIMIPTYHRVNLLKEAVNSALNQKTSHEYMVGVVDNAAEVDEKTDLLMQEYCERYPNLYYYRNEENLGMFGNWNRCIELARSEWLCLLHDDDLVLEWCVENTLNLKMESNVGLLLSMAQIINTDQNGKLTIRDMVYSAVGRLAAKPHVKRWRWMPRCSYNPTCMILKRPLSVEIGGFDEIFYPSSDISFCQKMSYYYDVKFLNKALSVRRMECNTAAETEIQKKGIAMCYGSSLEYFKVIGYPVKKAEQLAAEAAVELFMGLRCEGKQDFQGFLEEELGLERRYTRLLYQKIFYWYCLAIKFFKVIL